MATALTYKNHDAMAGFIFQWDALGRLILILVSQRLLVQWHVSTIYAIFVLCFSFCLHFLCWWLRQIKKFSLRMRPFNLKLFRDQFPSHVYIKMHIYITSCMDLVIQIKVLCMALGGGRRVNCNAWVVTYNII